MKILLFISFLSLSFISSAKVESWKGFLELLDKDNLKVRQINRSLKKLDYQDIISFDEKDPLSFSANDNELYSRFYSNQFTFFKLKDSNNYIQYKIKLYSYKRKVVFLSMKNMEDSVVEKKIVKNEFYAMVKIHNQKMKIIPDTSYPYFNPEQDFVFDLFCGENGRPSEIVMIVQQLVEDTNRREIKKWCHSLSPEVRCAGAYGLLWLRDKLKIQLTIEEKRLLTFIQNEEVLITTCNGCLDPIQYFTIKEFMKLDEYK